MALHDFLLAAYSNPDGPRGADQVLVTRRSVLKGAGAVIVAAVSGVSGAYASQLMDGDTGLLRRLDALEETVDEAFASDYEELDVVGDAATDFEYFNELNGVRRELARIHEEVADHTDQFGFGPIEASAMPILQALTITHGDARDHLVPRCKAMMRSGTSWMLSYVRSSRWPRSSAVSTDRLGSNGTGAEGPAGTSERHERAHRCRSRAGRRSAVHLRFRVAGVCQR